MIVDYFDRPTKIKVWDLDENWTYGLGKADRLYFNDGFEMSLKDYYEQVKIAHLWQEGPSVNRAIEIIE